VKSESSDAGKESSSDVGADAQDASSSTTAPGYEEKVVRNREL